VVLPIKISVKPLPLVLNNPQDMKDVADEIRLTGNEAAHGDILNEPISVTDAQEIVELTDAMLMRVYQEPGKVARVRASRLARKNKSQ
jgi:hypothetical protein